MAILYALVAAPDNRVPDARSWMKFFTPGPAGKCGEKKDKREKSLPAAQEKAANWDGMIKAHAV